MQKPNKMIDKSRIFNCAVDTLWWKWTTYDGLKTFFGEENKVELAIDGAYEIYFSMDQPVGQRGGEGNKIISYL